MASFDSRRLVGALITVVVAACDGTDPSNDGTLVALSGDAQVTLPGGQVPRPLVVRALDAQGNPREGVLVTWSASGGSEFVHDTSTTNADGVATVVWLLADAAGTYTATAREGSAEVTFAAQTAADALELAAIPASLNFASLDDTARVWIWVRSKDRTLDTLITPRGWGSPAPIVARPVYVGQPTDGMLLRSERNGAVTQSLNFGRIGVPITVTVRQVAVEVRITPVAGPAVDTLRAGPEATVNLHVIAVDARGQPIVDAEALAGVTWSSSNELVATVSNGVVQTRDDGFATITAHLDDHDASIVLNVWTLEPRDIATGAGATCAIVEGDGLACWGFRQVGNNSQLDVALTPELRAAPPMSSLSMFDGGACAVDADGQVWCWGRNESGELGNNTTGAYQATPAAATTSARFVAVDRGGGRACGLTSDGKVYCWGSAYEGAIGDGTYGVPCGNLSCRSVPTEVQGGGRIFTQVTVGGGHNCALADDGQAYCWGSNRYGQLGQERMTCAGYPGGDSTNGTNWCRTVPVGVTGDLRFKWLSAGISYTCGVTTAGKLYCWGSNLFGVFGVPDLSMGIQDIYTQPVAVAPEMEFSRVFAGRQHTCAVDAAGAAWCWGVGFAGQLGTGSIPTSTCANGVCERAPTRVFGDLKFAKMVLEASYTCGLTTDSVAYCWGWGGAGSLGTGGTENRLVPTRVAFQRP